VARKRRAGKKNFVKEGGGKADKGKKGGEGGKEGTGVEGEYHQKKKVLKNTMRIRGQGSMEEQNHRKKRWIGGIRKWDKSDENIAQGVW